MAAVMNFEGIGNVKRGAGSGLGEIIFFMFEILENVFRPDVNLCMKMLI